MLMENKEIKNNLLKKYPDYKINLNLFQARNLLPTL